MNLKQRLIEKKSVILRTWYEAILAMPGGKTSDLLEKQKALKTGAAGRNLAQEIEGLFDALLQGVIPDEVSRSLDSMMGTMAADNFKASEAVAFILEVKKAVRKELGNEVINDPHLQEELAAWDSVVDDLALFAFDIYARSRESVLELKADEAKKETLKLLKKAKLIPDDQE